MDSTAANLAYYLDRLNLQHSRTLLGAGAGSWDDLEFFEKFAATKVDYIDFHIYSCAR